MKKMEMRIIFGIALMICRPGFALAEDVTSNGIATVTLEVRNPVRIWNEVPLFTVRFRNNTATPLVCIPNAADASGVQLFIKVNRTDTKSSGNLEKCARTRLKTVENHGRWDRITNATCPAMLKPGESMDKSTLSKVELKLGETMEWKSQFVEIPLFCMNDGNPQSIQAQVMVGPNQWVSSPIVPVRVMAGDVHSLPRMFECKHVYPNSVLSLWVVKGVVDGKDYLFLSGFRICEIPPGATPHFENDGEKRLLKITFDGVNASPVLFNWRTGEIVEQEDVKSRSE